MINKICLILFWSCCVVSISSGALLPKGPEPEPLVFSHFPNRLDAFIWRNWNLVPVERLASVLQTSKKNVEKVAESLGCGPAEKSFFGRRIALTIIRRNWHLLDFKQLLMLLNWDEKELADCLVEHDFFWIKLGRLKPRCKPLYYSESTGEEKEAARWFKKIVVAERNRVSKTERVNRFSFIRDLSKMPATIQHPQTGDSLSIRFIYSYFAIFGDPLLHPELDPYPEGYLARLASQGVNGVWLHVVLSKLAPGKLFPEEKKNSETRLLNLRRLAKRANRYGIGIYLYFNEPRGQDEKFFKQWPNLRGVREGNLSALCTSTPEVKNFLRQGAERVFERVPELAGFFTITGSENLTNCYSHGRGAACPRCKNRKPAEVIAEVNTLLAKGAWSANPKAEAIVWDWGWAEDWVEGIIKRLPKRCRLMSVSEWSLPIKRGGIASRVGEYSLSAIGPGPRALSHWKIASKYGLRTMAKLQVNNTWELSSVPFIPVPGNVAEHLKRLRTKGLSGIMLSWSLGGYPSINIRVVEKYCGKDIPEVPVVLRDVARETYGLKAVPKILDAWNIFSKAFEEFPFHIGVLYNGPQQMGPANLLFPVATHYHATMTGFPYDDLNSWRAIYPPDIFQNQFRKMAQKWSIGIKLFEEALEDVPARLRPSAEKDLSVARAIFCHFESVANQVEFVRLREKLKAEKDNKAGQEIVKRLYKLCDKEIDLARMLYKITSKDSRIGFEAANQYFYLPVDLLEKIVNCRYIQERFPGFVQASGIR